MKIAIVGLVGLLTATSVFAAGLEPVSVAKIEQFGNLMPPLPPQGAAIHTQLSVRVASGGCTSAEDFVVKVAQKAQTQVVQIVRTKPDLCEAYFPEGVVIELETSKLKLDKAIVVQNPQFVIQNLVH